MMLRTHPKLKYKSHSSWPPMWGGSYGRGTKSPLGEQGTLVKVTKVPASGSMPAHLSLEIEYEGNKFSGPLLLDYPKLLDSFQEILQGCIGSNLQDIGDKEINLPE